MRTRPATLPAAVCVSAAIGACGQRIGRVEIAEGQVPQGVILPAATAVVADFAPARIEVHPLSRLEGVGDERRAVVQVQVLDAFGHDVKWPGAVSVEVSPNESFAPSRVRWVDITQGEPNARLFDTISRCYALRVAAPGEGAVHVRVRWLLGDLRGQPGELTATGVLLPAR